MRFKLSSYKNQKGFTLIELLVVVLVISALSGIVVSMINTGGFRDKARDAQRVADLMQIQTALELYFSDNRAYPASTGANDWAIVDGSGNLEVALEPNYINAVPTDPEMQFLNSGPCSGATDNYRYNYRSDGTYYILTSIMAVTSSNDGNECTSLNNWGSNCGAMDTQDVCYGVENP